MTISEMCEFVGFCDIDFRSTFKHTIRNDCPCTWWLHIDSTEHILHGFLEALSDLPFEYQNNAGMTSDKSNLLMMSNPKFVRNTRSNPVFYNMFFAYSLNVETPPSKFCCFEFISLWGNIFSSHKFMCQLVSYAGIIFSRWIIGWSFKIWKRLWVQYVIDARAD